MYYACIQNKLQFKIMRSKFEFTCENTKILITVSEISSSGHEDPLSSLENATLKISTVFCSSEAVKKKKNYTFVVHSNLNFQMKCESSRSTTNS